MAPEQWEGEAINSCSKHKEKNISFYHPPDKINYVWNFKDNKNYLNTIFIFH